MVVSSQAQTEQMIKRYADAKSSIPLALVAPKAYELDGALEGLLSVTVQACNLRFGLTEQGVESEAHCRCHLYQLTSAPVYVSEVAEINLGESVAVTYRIELVTDLLKGRGIWVPFDADLLEGRRYLKTLLGDSWNMVRDIWQPKSLGRGKFLVKTAVADALQLHEKLLCGGICVAPPSEVINRTKVVWLRGVKEQTEAALMVEQALSEAPATSPLQQSRIPWSKQTALVTKADRWGVSFGIRIPTAQAETIANALGRDGRQNFHLYGASREWVSEDLKSICTQMGWSAEPVRVTRGRWINDHESKK
eukprot:6460750-Amphidinium_carterae.1